MKRYTEAQAIAALERLSRRWPPQLSLFSNMGALLVIRGLTGNGGQCLASINIPNDGGDVQFEDADPEE